MRITVTLQWYEMLQGAHVGMMRKIECIKQGKKDAHGAHYERDWSIDIEGAIAEVAAAKALGMFWPGGINTWKKPDLGSNIQVRYSQSEDDPHMVIRPDDNDDEIYVLVSPGDAQNEYIVHGWMRGYEAKAHEEWVSHAYGRPKCWRVPAHMMKSFDVLKLDCLPQLAKKDQAIPAV